MIYLMRHGLDDENYIGGWSNVSLVSEGEQQVKEACSFLSNIKLNRIISSDVLRAKQTASIVSNYLSIDVIYDLRLRELDKGLLTGLSIKEADFLFPNRRQLSIYDKYPEGEAMIDLYRRIKLLLDEIKDWDNTLLITHRGVINMIYYILNDIELDMDKKKFNVTHASIHEANVSKRLVRRIY